MPLKEEIEDEEDEDDTEDRGRIDCVGRRRFPFDGGITTTDRGRDMLLCASVLVVVFAVVIYMALL